MTRRTGSPGTVWPAVSTKQPVMLRSLTVPRSRARAPAQWAGRFTLKRLALRRSTPISRAPDSRREVGLVLLLDLLDLPHQLVAFLGELGDALGRLRQLRVQLFERPLAREQVGALGHRVEHLGRLAVL